MEQTIDLKIENCWTDSAEPTSLIFKNGERTIFSCLMRAPSWADYIDIATNWKPEKTAETNAKAVAICIQSWSLDCPITAENVLRLHPSVVIPLLQQANRLLQIDEAQLGNSEKLSPSNGSQPNGESGSA